MAEIKLQAPKLKPEDMETYLKEFQVLYKEVQAFVLQQKNGQSRCGGRGRGSRGHKRALDGKNSFDRSTRDRLKCHKLGSLKVPIQQILHSAELNLTDMESSEVHLDPNACGVHQLSIIGHWTPTGETNEKTSEPRNPANVLVTGKRNLLAADIPLAVSSFSEAYERITDEEREDIIPADSGCIENILASSITRVADKRKRSGDCEDTKYD